MRPHSIWAPLSGWSIHVSGHVSGPSIQGRKFPIGWRRQSIYTRYIHILSIKSITNELTMVDDHLSS